MLYGNWDIRHVCRKYKCTSSGKSWKTKPFEEIAETVDTEFYNNFVDSIIFFNGFMGWTCRGYRGYTRAGYVVVSVTTINPARDIKQVDTFKFL